MSHEVLESGIEQGRLAGYADTYYWLSGLWSGVDPLDVLEYIEDSGWRFDFAMWCLGHNFAVAGALGAASDLSYKSGYMTGHMHGRSFD